MHDHLQQADAVLVVGSSLMVYSGFRFVQAAAKAGLPVAALNRGRTRADDLLLFKDERDCAEALSGWGLSRASARLYRLSALGGMIGCETAIHPDG